MRLYTFNNFYLSSLQQGLQSAHVTHDLFVKYPNWDIPAAGDTLWDWAKNHKTMILLNGGMASNLLEVERFFQTPTNPFPWCAFREEAIALNNCITSVGIVLPGYIYEGAAAIRAERLRRDDMDEDTKLYLTCSDVVDHHENAYTDFELDLMFKLNQCRLAS